MDLLKTSCAVLLALLPLAISIMIKMDILYGFVGLVITMVISYNILRNWFDQYRIPHIRGKYVLVTGCDSGFGRRIAERLAKKGVKVIAGCLLGETVARLQEAEDDNMIPVVMDVSRDDSIQHAYNALVETHPQIQQGLWGIVNNAGILGSLVPSEWLGREDFLKVLGVNALGPVMVNNRFLTLVKRARGRVVNTTSFLSRLSPPFNTQYTMAKFALRSYTDGLRRELYHFGVSVHTIEPGSYKTGLSEVDVVDRNIQNAYDRLDPELQQQWGQEFVDKYKKICTMSLSMVTSPRLDMVVDAYEHALFATYPRTRYRVGMDSRLMSFFTMLPDWLQDLLFNMTGEKPCGIKPFTT